VQILFVVCEKYRRKKVSKFDKKKEEKMNLHFVFLWVQLIVDCCLCWGRFVDGLASGNIREVGHC
jgi:hypothetical protein